MGERGLAVGEGVGDALHHGPGHVGQSVRARQADEGAAGGGVVVRGPFSGEVREEGEVGRRRVGIDRGGEIGGGLPRDPGEPFEAVGGREDHAHLVPGVRDRVAEGVDRSVGIGREGGVGDEEHAGGAERDEGAAGSDHADAAGRRGVVAGAARDDHVFRGAPALGEVGAEIAGDGAAFDETGHLGAGQSGGGEKIVRPVAGGDVEPKGSGGVGHLGDVVAGQHQADVVLRQKDHGDAVEDLGLMVTEPLQLRGGEAGHRDVAGDAAAVGEGGLDLGAFRAGASVVPQDGGAQDRVVGVEADRAVHLAGEADAAQLAEAMGLGQGVDRGEHAGPPVGGVLFGPAGMRARDFEMMAGLADQRLIRVEERGFDRGCSDVDAEICRAHSFPRPIAHTRSWRGGLSTLHRRRAGDPAFPGCDPRDATRVTLSLSLWLRNGNWNRVNRLETCVTRAPTGRSRHRA